MEQEFKDYRIEQASAYLERIRRMSIRLISLSASIEQQRAIASGLTGIDYSRDVVATSPTDAKVPESVHRTLERVKELQDLHSEFERHIGMACAAIDRMPHIECAAALELHYVSAKSWAHIAEALGYSKQGMMSLRKRALNEFYDVMPLTQRDQIPKAL